MSTVIAPTHTDWIQTFLGKQFWPLEPRVEDIDIRDIAHALCGLLHDASEAYLIDVPRPIKRSPGMQAYRDAEARLEQVIAERFQLPYPLPAEIKTADNQLLRTEQRDLMKVAPAAWEDNRVGALDFKIEPWIPQHASNNFLGKEMTMEEKIRKAFALANELARDSEDYGLTFTLVFNACLAGTSANPLLGNDDLVCAIREMSTNLGKYGALIVEALLAQGDSAAMQSLTDRLKAQREKLQSAVEKNTPEL